MMRTGGLGSRRSPRYVRPGQQRAHARGPSIAAARRAFFLTFDITQRAAPADPAGATSPVWWSLVGEVSVDVVGDRRSRGDKITPGQALPTRHERTSSQVLVSTTSPVPCAG